MVLSLLDACGFWPPETRLRDGFTISVSADPCRAPTVMEAAGLPFPKSINGTAQKSFEGVSLVYSFDTAKANSRHTTQYFEIAGDNGASAEGGMNGMFNESTAAAACKCSSGLA